MYHLDVPAEMTLERRPSHDDREEPRPQLRTADGHVMALVESVDPTDVLPPPAIGCGYTGWADAGTLTMCCK